MKEFKKLAITLTGCAIAFMVTAKLCGFDHPNLKLSKNELSIAA